MLNNCNLKKKQAILEILSKILPELNINTTASSGQLNNNGNNNNNGNGNNNNMSLDR